MLGEHEKSLRITSLHGLVWRTIFLRAGSFYVTEAEQAEEAKLKKAADAAKPQEPATQEYAAGLQPIVPQTKVYKQLYSICLEVSLTFILTAETVSRNNT
jgi:hypothetical protein